MYAVPVAAQTLAKILLHASNAHDLTLPACPLLASQNANKHTRSLLCVIFMMW